jgi:hypothetical protein
LKGEGVRILPLKLSLCPHVPSTHHSLNLLSKSHIAFHFFLSLSMGCWMVLGVRGRI